MNKEEMKPAVARFWQDVGEEQISTMSDPPWLFKLLVWFSKLVLISSILVLFSFLSFLDESPLSPVCGAFFLLVIMSSFLSSYFFRRRMKANSLKAMNIQDNAKQKSGASLIGSAMHVAGHPILERDQQVVVALTEDELQFYAYDESEPLTSIRLGEITDVKTVIYDDERVPHADVIDSAAQALQVEFVWKGQACSTLFKTMKQIQPIDWYHAIQKARFTPQAEE